jgi:ribosomal protein S30
VGQQGRLRALGPQWTPTGIARTTDSGKASENSDTKSKWKQKQVGRQASFRTNSAVLKNVPEIAFSAVCGERKQTPRIRENRRKHSKPRSLKKIDYVVGVQEVPGSNPGGPTKVLRDLQPNSLPKILPHGVQFVRCPMCGPGSAGSILPEARIQT